MENKWNGGLFCKEGESLSDRWDWVGKGWQAPKTGSCGGSLSSPRGDAAWAKTDQTQGLSARRAGLATGRGTSGSCRRSNQPCFFVLVAESWHGSLWARWEDVKQQRWRQRSQKWGGCYSTLHPLGHSKMTNLSFPCLRTRLTVPWLNPRSHQGRYPSGARAAHYLQLIAMPLLHVMACFISVVVSEPPRMTLLTSPFKQHYLGLGWLTR